MSEQQTQPQYADMSLADLAKYGSRPGYGSLCGGGIVRVDGDIDD